MLGLSGLLLAVFLDLFGLGVIRPVLPLYVQEVFKVDIFQVSFIPAAFGIGKLLANIPAGLVMDRLGRPRLMGAGLALGSDSGSAQRPGAGLPSISSLTGPGRARVRLLCDHGGHRGPGHGRASRPRAADGRLSPCR
ncbi:MAG: MFS transporter [bacterium]